jgi:hypothetical protein
MLAHLYDRSLPTRTAMVSWCTLNSFSVSLKLFGFDRTLRLIDQRLTKSADLDCEQAIIERTRVALGTAKGWHLRLTSDDCLPVALSALYLLRARGVEATLVLGVAKHPFNAHAWVATQYGAIDYPANKYKEYASIVAFTATLPPHRESGSSHRNS